MFIFYGTMGRLTNGLLKKPTMIIEYFTIVGLNLMMKKYNLQNIRDFSYKEEINFNSDGSISSLFEVGFSNFKVKHWYPIDNFFYTDDENYRIEYIAKKNNLTKEEYISMLEKERIKVSGYLTSEKKVNTKICKENKVEINNSFLEKIRQTAKTNN